MRYLIKWKHFIIAIGLLIAIIELSSCGSVAGLTPPKNLPNNFPQTTVYPKIDKPINNQP